MITIVDYAAGNLASVYRAVTALGFEAQVTADPVVIGRASKIIFPGVGAASRAMKELKAGKLIEPLTNAIANGIPFLGICLGMQILFDYSEENGGVDCFGILPGWVKRFGFDNKILNSKFEILDSKLKVPHMGWNRVKQLPEASSQMPDYEWLWEGIEDKSWYYFVHSYYVEPAKESLIIGTTDYGNEFVSVIARDNLVATQFHPEKSGRVGWQLLNNFCKRRF